MANVSEIDVNIVCRICLSCSEDMKSLYETSSSPKDISFAEMLMTATPLKCFGNDGFPTQICHSCIEELNRSYNFQLKCLDADNILRKNIDGGKVRERDIIYPECILGSSASVATPDVKFEMEDDVNIGIAKNMNIIEEIYVPGKPLSTDQSRDLIKNKVDGVKIEKEDDIEIRIPIMQIETIENESSMKENTNGANVAGNTEMNSIATTTTTTYNQNNNLTNDMQAPTRGKTYACTYCGKSFSGQSNLTIHIRKHTGEKPYICTVCNNSFTRKRNLLRHNMRKHTGSKPYLCSVCNNRFSEKSSLATHMRTHSEKKPFMCTVCDAAFRVKQNLTRHVQTHTGEKPFLCTVCKATFSVKPYLTSHMRTHSEKKPYSCTVCNSSFKVKQSLTRHMRTHIIGDNTYSCTV